MNTQENNELIAEFMGAKPMYLGASKEYEMYGIIESIIDGVDEKHFFIDDEMFFSTDWNWLMQVIEKIESLEFQPKSSTCIGFDTFGVEINKTRCDITRYGDFTSSLLQGNGKTRIESVYNAVVLFIQWYNEQK